MRAHTHPHVSDIGVDRVTPWNVFLGARGERGHKRQPRFFFALRGAIMITLSWRLPVGNGIMMNKVSVSCTWNLGGFREGERPSPYVRMKLAKRVFLWCLVLGHTVRENIQQAVKQLWIWFYETVWFDCWWLCLGWRLLAVHRARIHLGGLSVKVEIQQFRIIKVSFPLMKKEKKQI